MPLGQSPYLLFKAYYNNKLGAFMIFSRYTILHLGWFALFQLNFILIFVLNKLNMFGCPQQPHGHNNRAGYVLFYHGSAEMWLWQLTNTDYSTVIIEISNFLVCR